MYRNKLGINRDPG
jgi:hypothetical protein